MQHVSRDSQTQNLLEQNYEFLQHQQQQHVPPVSTIEQSYESESSDNHTPTSKVAKKFCWKPYSMRLPFLILMLCYTLSIIALLEYMLRRQKWQGAVYFLQEGASGFTLSQTFVENYLLTTLSVIYGMLLAILDLDIKRMEPFYQLAKKNGAYATSSLLLSYPSDYLPFVPLKAARQRHWLVFLVGISTGITFWGITPALSAVLLDSDAVNRTVPADFVLQMGLNNTWDLSKYNVWGLEDYAQFKTGIKSNKWVYDRYMIRSFDHPIEYADEIWIADSSVYYNNITCHQATIQSNDSHDFIEPASVHNGSYGPVVYRAEGINCALKTYLPYDLDSPMYSEILDLSTIVEDIIAPIELASVCQENAYQYFVVQLAMPSNSSSTLDTSPVLICREILSRAIATVTYQYGFGDVSDQDVSQFDIVNVTNLTHIQELSSSEDVLSTFREAGFNTDRSSDFTQDPWEWIPHTYTEFNLSLSIRDSSAPLYYLTVEPDINQWMNSSRLKELVEEVRQRLFPYIMSTTMELGLFDQTDDPIQNNTTSGKRIVTVSAILISHRIARAAQGILAGVAVALGIILVICQVRPLNLYSDPGSIASVASLIYQSQQLQQSFADTHDSDKQRLKAQIQAYRYFLKIWDDGSYRLDKDQDQVHHTQGQAHTLQMAAPAHSTKQVVLPKVLKSKIGFGIIGAYLCLLATLAVLMPLNKRYSGFLPLSNNKNVQALIYSYVPTIIATMIEPSWTLLARQLAILQPLKSLAVGDARAKDTITATYMVQPVPQLIYTCGISSLSSCRKKGRSKRRPILLTFVALMSLIANFLAVGLGGLFSKLLMSNRRAHTFLRTYDPVVTSVPRIITSLSSTSLKSSFQPSDFLLNQDDISHKDLGLGQDDVAVLLWSVSGQLTKKPGWTMDDVFFLPVNGSDPWDRRAEELSNSIWIKPSIIPQYSILGTSRRRRALQTMTYRAKLNCTKVQPQVSIDSSSVITQIQFNTTTSSGRQARCYGSFASNHTLLFTTEVTTSQAYPLMRAYNAFGVPYKSSLNSSDIAEDNACRRLFTSSTSRAFKGELGSSSTFVCEPYLQQVPQSLWFFEDNRITAHKPWPTSENFIDWYDLDSSFFTGNVSQDEFLATVRRMLSITYTSSAIHQGYMVNEYWTSYVIDRIDVSSQLFNSSLPILDDHNLTETLSLAYQRTFAYFMAAYHDQILVPKNSSSVPHIEHGHLSYYENRWFMNNTWFRLCLAILILYIGVCIVIYGFSYNVELPRFPNSIADIVASLYLSKKLHQVVEGTEDLSQGKRHTRVESEDNRRYGYGEVLQNGNLNYAIEQIPIEYPAKLDKGPLLLLCTSIRKKFEHWGL